MLSRNRVSSGASAGAFVWSGVLGLLILVGLLWLIKSKLAVTSTHSDSQSEISANSEARGPSMAPTERPAIPPSLPRSATKVPVPPESSASAQGADAAESKAVLYDPFERHGTEDPPARVLVAVGDLQLGVLTSARVHDEVHLVELLTRLGGELEKLRSAPEQPAEAARQQLLEGYRKELGRYLDGEVELRGRDWLMGFEVGAARPMELDWKPRPN